MKKVFLTLCMALALFANGANAVEKEKVERPKLVVGIVVDQMRWDYLYRYYDMYGEGGFKRLLANGFSCENMMLDYVPTVTAIGHTCIYTGSVPSIHGIAGNDFIIERTGKKMYCTDDATVRGVGSDNAAGKMSPRNLLVTTITDELRLATNMRSKTIGISLKDRAAILPAGHTANAAYWFDAATGRWISSTYYMKERPGWVEAYNKTNPVARLLSQGWNTMYPIEQYTQSTDDDTRYEKPFVKGQAPVMPVKTAELLKTEGYGVIRNTPYGNTMTLQMAEEALKNEKMGQGEYTDFLAVSLSSTDYIGHQFGANAVETEDTYIRLDKDLADFFNFLDENVGSENYTLFLTADHAAAHNVRFLADHKIGGEAWKVEALEASLDSLVEARFNVKDGVRAIMNYQVNLNRQNLESAKADYQQVKDAVIDFLKEQRGVAYVIDQEKAAMAAVPEPIRERVINGYNHERSGAIQIVLNPGWYEGDERGTTHGVWCPYDAHVPLIFMGWGVNRGKTFRETHLTDISATLAALLKIQMPNGCIGQPITEIIK